MRQLVGGVVLAGLIATGGYLVKDRFGGARLGGTPAAIEAPWRTEEQWLVDSICRDIGEMARFASNGRASTPLETTVTPAASADGLPWTVSLKLGDGRVVRQELPLKTFVWAPEEYKSLASALLDPAARQGAEAAAPLAAPTDLLRSLTDLRAETIEQANDQVSRRLAARFTDSAAHEAAGLVLAAFALREAADMYSDVRGPLSRITAHLAVAAALRKGPAPSVEGQYAAAALLVLAGRGADALGALERLQADTTPGGAAWRSALRRRLLEDTRFDPDPTSLLERRELYRAHVHTVAADDALRHLETLGKEPVTDWWRITSEAGFTVEVANTLLDDVVERELDEVRRVGQITRGGSLDDAGLIAALNEPARRCVGPEGPRVIAWGTWAAQLQRHLINALWWRDRHLRSMLGLPQKADGALADAGRRFGRLTLYPLIETRCEMEARRRPQRYDELITLTVEHPDLLNAGQWYSMGDAARYEVIQRGMPDPRAWFAPGSPRGTTFDSRARRFALLLPREVARMRALHAISPQDFWLTRALVDVQFGEKGPLAEVEQLFGARADYDLNVLGVLGPIAARDAGALGGILQRKCALVPVHCFEYGEHLVAVGEDDQAARAYQRGFDEAADRVSASHNAFWLMNHWLDAGQSARARALAEEAGGTGSGTGLVTLSRFHERTGDYETARELLEQVRARYGNQPMTPDEQEEARDGEQDQDELAAFHFRMSQRKGHESEREEFQRLVGDAFPRGLERVDRAALEGQPGDGAFILRVTPRGEGYGLRVGDIIVGLDGYRVRTRRQYYLIRRLSDSPDMTLHLYRRPGYVELKARSATRRLGFEMRTHKTGS